MTKTIEELAKQYAEDMCPVGDYCGGVYDEQRNSDLPIYTDDAKSVLRWLFDKPLIDRMTAEEKERVRKEYNWAKVSLSQLREGGFNELDPDVVLCSGVIRTLNRIFGADFFKEEE